MRARLTCRKDRFTLAAVIVDVVVSDGHVTAVARVRQAVRVTRMRSVQLLVPNACQQRTNFCL